MQQPGTQEDDAVPPPEHIRVAVADDAFLMREAISHVLARLPEIELVSVSADGDQLREAVSNTPVDVVLTDIRMPPSGDEEGVKLAHWLATEHPQVGVVLLSQYAEARFGIELLADGAAGRGYLVKERVQDAAELMRTIRVVAHGGVVIDAKLVPLLIHAADMRRDSRLAELTAASATCWPRCARSVERRDRDVTRAHQAGGGEAHQLDLPEAAAGRRGRRQPARLGRAALPVGRRSVSTDHLPCE